MKPYAPFEMSTIKVLSGYNGVALAYPSKKFSLVWDLLDLPFPTQGYTTWQHV